MTALKIIVGYWDKKTIAAAGEFEVTRWRCGWFLTIYKEKTTLICAGGRESFTRWFFYLPGDIGIGFHWPE